MTVEHRILFLTSGLYRLNPCPPTVGGDNEGSGGSDTPDNPNPDNPNPDIPEKPGEQLKRSIAIKDPNHLLGSSPHIYLWIYKDGWSQAWEFCGGWPGTPMTPVQGTTDEWEVNIEVPQDVKDQGLMADIRMLFNDGATFNKQTIDLDLALDGSTYIITEESMTTKARSRRIQQYPVAAICAFDQLPEYLQRTLEQYR